MSSFDPSVLENKDREQLSQIAEQLGKKPPTRAKKADIVALILELAGVASTESTGAGTEDEGAPVPPNADSDDGRESSKPKDAARADSSNDGPVGADAPPRAHDQARNGGGQPNQPSQRSGSQNAGESTNGGRNRGGQSAGQNSGGQNGGGQSRGQQDGGGNQGGGNQGGGNQGGGNQGGGNQDRGRQDGGGGQQRGQQEQRGQQDGGNQRSPSQGGGDEADSGNRRRRRRGRGAQDQDDSFQGEPVAVDGLLDLRDEGYGFLRTRGYLQSAEDAYVSVKQVRQFALRKGDQIVGKSRPALRNEKNPALVQIDSVNGGDPEQMKQRVHFEDLTPLFPDSRLELEVAKDPGNMTTRIIDLVAPIGKGQRGLIVSPPKAGKTSVMKEIARSIETNHPEVELIVLLVDERPEEVTDMKRWLQKGHVAASTFDRPAEEHTLVAELVIERAKRQVEEGKDVVIILDGITRLARAYNLAAPATGRIMSGGIDTGALYPPKKFFGAARNVEEGGSLTILATALVETGSRMDEVIFEEFKGTGNMELKLDRRMADRRIFPAIDVEASSTRREELLFDPKQLEQVWKLRRVLAGLKSDEGGSAAAGIELLIDRMKSFRSNNAFLAEIGKAP